MKKNLIFVSALLVLFVLASIGFGKATLAGDSAKVDAEQAKKIALKRVEGTVVDEYVFEDDDGEPETFVFVIKKKDNKVFEVQVGAEKGDIKSVEEYEQDDTPEEPSEDPPVQN